MPYLLSCGSPSGTYNYWVNLKEPEPIDGSPLVLAFYSGAELTSDLRAHMPKVAAVEAGAGGPKDGIRMETANCIMYSGIGIYAVCTKLKDKLEELEPGVHEFFPLQMTTGGKDMGGIYYLLYVTQKLDAIVYDKTDFAHPLHKGIEAAKASGFHLGSFGAIVLKKDVIAGRHLWRGTCGDPKYYKHGKYDIMARKYFISDELADFLKAEKILGWKLRTCVVD